MINVIKNAPSNVAAFEAKGHVDASDFELVFDRVQEVINQHGELRYMLDLKTDVSNFTAGAWLKDLLLGIKHLTKWERCAIITNSEMIDQATQLMNTFAIGEFKVFDKKDFDKAMNWVSGKQKTQKSNNNSMAALAAGFGGAVALNILHETMRKNCSNVPEVNKVGEEALSKMLDTANVHLKDDELYGATLAADLVSNGLYYSALATNKAGLFSGLLGGIGAVALPKYLGLDDRPVASTDRKKILTVAYYTAGAAVTMLLYRAFKNK